MKQCCTCMLAQADMSMANTVRHVQLVHNELTDAGNKGHKCSLMCRNIFAISPRLNASVRWMASKLVRTNGWPACSGARR